MVAFFDNDYLTHTISNWTYPPGSPWLDSIAGAEYGLSHYGDPDYAARVSAELLATPVYTLQEQISLMDANLRNMHADVLDFLLDQKLTADSLQWDKANGAIADAQGLYNSSFAKAYPVGWSPPDMVGDRHRDAHVDQSNTHRERRTL